MTDEVRQAAALMDARWPGWATRVDVGRLDLSDCVLCVIGQAVLDRPFYSWAREARAVTGLPNEGFYDHPITQTFACNSYRNDWIDAIADRVCQVPTSVESVAVSHETVSA